MGQYFVERRGVLRGCLPHNLLEHSMSKGRPMKVLRLPLPALLVIAFAASVSAQALVTPEFIHHQGFLTDGGGVPIDATHSLTFALYSGATKVWEETHPSVSIDDGVFDIALGSQTPFDTLTFNQIYTLGIKIDGGTELSPRTSLGRSPYALNLRGIRVEPNRGNQDAAPSIIGGDRRNRRHDESEAVTIAGGGGIADGGTGSEPLFHYASASFATIGGGLGNTAGQWSTVSGGAKNFADDYFATVGGGTLNTAGDFYATVPGGRRNKAIGEAAFAAGQGAQALHDATFVWHSTTSNTDSLVSTGPNQFIIGASGGVGIGTNAPDRMLHLSGDDAVIRVDRDQGVGGASILLHQYAPGAPTAPWNSFVMVSSATSSGVGAFEIRDLGSAVSGGGALRMRINDAGFVGLNTGSAAYPLQVGTAGNTSTGNGAYVTTGGVWADASSRTFKTNFEDVDPHDILERLAALPIATWEYKDSDEGRHMGPVAEDFHEAFRLGDNERYISGTDARGVSMAAIQALYELVREQQAVIDAQRGVIEDYGDRLATLEARMR
jgi:hypothetical protein